MEGANSGLGTKRAVARRLRLSWTMLGRIRSALSVVVSIPAVIEDFVSTPIAQAVVRLVWCGAVLVGADIRAEIPHYMSPAAE